MLIQTIAFDVTDFKMGVAERFLVENTPENFEWIASQNNTRQIEFGKTFDFQYEKEMRMPFDMIDSRFINAIVLLTFDSNQQKAIISGKLVIEN